MVRIYHTSTLVKSFKINLLRDVTLSVPCLSLLEQRTFKASKGVVAKNYELRAVQNQTRSCCTTLASSAHLPHVDASKIIRDRPASRCHAISAVFVAARQRTFKARKGADEKNYELRPVQNQTHCSCCTTSARCLRLSAGT